MPHPKAPRKKVSVSTKLALGIIVVVAIVALLFYSPDELSFGQFGSIKTGLPDTSGLFGSSGGPRLSFVLTSNQSIVNGEVTVKDALVTIKGVHNIPTSIGDAVFDNFGKQSEVTFVGFDGKITVVGGTGLTLEGTATSAVSDGTAIKPKSETFQVEADLKPTSYAIDPVSIKNLDLTGAFGTIEKLGKESSTVQIKGGKVSVKDFSGGMTFDGSKYRLSGDASKIQGASFTLTG